MTLETLIVQEVHAETIFELLNVTRTQSVHGFHMCRSTILQASIIRGEHQPGRDEFKVSSLFEDLGVSGHPRIDSSSVAQCDAFVRAVVAERVGMRPQPRRDELAALSRV